MQIKKSTWSGGIYTPTPRIRGTGLAADGHGYGFTPEAHGGVVHAEDAAVFPLGERGGLRVGIGVAGRGVVGEVDEAFAVAAIHFQAQDIQPFAVAVEFPRDLDSAGCHVRREGDGVFLHDPEWLPQKIARNAKIISHKLRCAWDRQFNSCVLRHELLGLSLAPPQKCNRVNEFISAFLAFFCGKGLERRFPPGR